MSEQMTLGEVHKAAGMATALEAEDGAWLELAHAAMFDATAQGLRITAEWVRARAGDPRSMGSMGALFSEHRKHGCIRQRGFVQATRKEAHGRWIQEWVGTGLRCPPGPPESIQNAPLAEATSTHVGEPTARRRFV